MPDSARRACLSATPPCCAHPEELRLHLREWYASVEVAHDKLAEDWSVILAGGLSIGSMVVR